ncbi:hypothetical protein RI129_010620 [Pyrocoelia pectoralis]|uniref:Dynein regulatory complex protein 9 n=1 Tax=Pyrocoelia pectoralis TaxID=417401 RepID=A0AAN7V9L0_9COLE
MTKGRLRGGQDGDILDPVSCIAARITLEACVEELEILKTMLREVERESCNQLYRYVPPKQRYHPIFLLFENKFLPRHLRFGPTPKEQKILEEEVYESIPYTNVKKLMEDIGFLTTTMKETCAEISHGGCFQTLIQVTDDFEREKSENEAIEAEHRHSTVEIVHLRQNLRDERESFRKRLNTNHETVLGLQDQFESILGMGATYLLSFSYLTVLAEGNQRFSYLSDWETAREDQNNLRLFLKEKLYIDETNSYLDLINDIQRWMERYDSEIERMDALILKMKIMRETMETDYGQLQYLYDLDKVKVDKLLWEKEEKRRKKELQRLQFIASVIIQRWWRQVMMEKHLGPYKIKKKEKDKNKKSKK